MGDDGQSVPQFKIMGIFATWFMHGIGKSEERGEEGRKKQDGQLL